MSPRQGPTLRAQWLGQQLRELREGARLTLRDAGEYLQRDPSTLSRVESGAVPARFSDVLALMNLYGVDEERQRQALEQLSRDIWRKGWWEGYADHVAEWFIDHAWLESRAQTIRWFEALVIPGLLQTRPYAEATIQAADPNVSHERFERWVQFRMERQGVLERESPPKLHVVLDEAAVRRPIGGPEVMRTQLHQLLDHTERPGMEVRILPLSAREHACPTGPFTIFELAEPFPDVGYADSLAGGIYVESEKVERFWVAYKRLSEAALEPQDSAALIAAAAKELT